MTVTAAAAGTRPLDDLTVNRLGFGAMRLTGGAVFGRAAPGDRDRSISVLRRARRDSGPAVPPAAGTTAPPAGHRAARGAGGTSGRGVRAAPLPTGRRGPRIVELLKNLPGKGLTPSSRPAYG